MNLTFIFSLYVNVLSCAVSFHKINPCILLDLTIKGSVNLQMAEKVFFHYADRKLKLLYKRIVKDCLIQLFEKERKLLERLDYVFCSDEYLLQINKQFLQHDYYTDIISFDLSDSKNIVGEIYISVDRVKENAITHSSPFTDEVVRVIGHGALHLCGYKDKSKKDIDIMRKKENEFIASFHSSVPRETKE